jgi:ABC-type glycerol-3-phosphate transport system substrate-binding protein
MKKLSLLVVFLLIGSLILFAGGKQEESTESAAPVDDGYNLSEPAKVSLLAFGFPAAENIAERLEEIGDQVNNLDTSSKLVGWGTLIEQINITLSSQGDAPYDLIMTYSGNIAEYASKGWLYDMNDLKEKYWDEYNLGDIPDSLWESVKYEGATIAFPYSTNLQFLFYRKDLFDKYDVKVPTTYDEWIEACEKLEDASEIQAPLGLTMNKPSGIATEFRNALYAHGGKWFDEDGYPAFNSPEGLKALETLGELSQYFAPGGLSFSNDDVMVGLQQSQIAMGNIWFTRAKAMDDPDVSAVVGKIEYAPAPVAKETGIPHSHLTFDSYSIPANTGDDPDVVFHVLMDIFSEEGIEDFATSIMSVRSSVLNDPELGEQMRWLDAAAKTVDSGVTSNPNVPYMSLTNSLVGEILADSLAGNMSYQDALDKAEKELTATLKEQGFIE